ncbi:MAG: Uma2 family endonuclease [Chloroflexaceae bacterium]|nr:Uma2 family endonuclease [Chloroflexaceae bacterium]
MIETATETVISTNRQPDVHGRLHTNGRSAADALVWPHPQARPPQNLPDNDGAKMESPWHFKNATLLLANYIAANDTQPEECYIGANMFIYYSQKQVKHQHFKGPDLFIVRNVDRSRPRRYWANWEEGGRLPNVIIELLSQSTRRYDLTDKKDFYEQVFATDEYFCVDPEVKTLLGWRHDGSRYRPILPDARGWLWSEQIALWLGPWQGHYFTEEHTWLRLYHPDGQLVLLPEEAERQRANTAEQRANTAEQRADTAEQALLSERQRVAALLAEIDRLKAQQ